MSNNKIALHESNKALIREAFCAVIENAEVSEATIAHYFSPIYMQWVDGKVLNFEQFIAHMKAQKSVVQSVKVNFLHMLAEKNIVSTVHEVEAIKKNGSFLRAKVIAFFTIQEGKIVACEELTHLLEGDREDRDLGSRTK